MKNKLTEERKKYLRDEYSDQMLDFIERVGNALIPLHEAAQRQANTIQENEELVQELHHFINKELPRLAFESTLYSYDFWEDVEKIVTNKKIKNKKGRNENTVSSRSRRLSGSISAKEN